MSEEINELNEPSAVEEVEAVEIGAAVSETTSETQPEANDNFKYYLLFDLDGTITDPKEGICTCVQYALKHFGIDEPDLDKLEPFIGPPLRESFPKFYGLTPEQTEEAVAKYRERYADVGIYEAELYPGINQLFRALRDAGMHLAVASSKPEVYVRRVLDKFKITQYFEEIVGSELDGTRDSKDEVIMEALARLFKGKPVRFDQVYMIGDTKYDIMGAHKVGLEAVGVTYGYGGMEELKEAKADYILQSVNDLRKFLLRGTDEPSWVEGMLATREATDEKAKKAQENLAAKKAAENGGQNRFGKKPLKMRNAIILVYTYIIFVLVKWLLIRIAFPSLLLNFANTFAPGSAMDRFLFVRDSAGQLEQYNPNLMTVLLGVSFLIALIPVKEYARQIIARTKEESHLLHLKKEAPMTYVLFGLTALGIVLGFNLAVSLLPATMERYYLAGGLSPQEVEQVLDRTFGSLRTVTESQYACHFLIGLLVYGFATPFAEEVVFRGILHAYLRRFYPVKFALLISAVLFAYYHGNTIQGTYAFIMGLLLAYAYEYFGDFKAPVILHMAVNLVSYILTYTLGEDSIFYNYPTCGIAFLIAIVSITVVSKKKNVLVG